MARITFVNKAQQRYATVPVLDAEGKPKRTPVIDRRTGQQKVTKRGPQFLTVTVADKSQPLPMPKCDFPGCKHETREIKVGTPYKHISPKSGPYGGRTMYRHGDCPSWNVWEYSSSLSARVAEISHNAWESFPESADAQEDIEAWLEDVATEVESLADEKEEGADNIEDGFGHETSTSSELRETAESLRGWADDIRGADLPDVPEPEETDCEDCDGTGEVEDPENPEAVISCETCEGEGTFTPDEPTEDQWNDWREEVRDAVSIVDECPV